MWEPLPLIVYGYAIHPLSPNRRETKTSSRHRLSTVTEASTDDNSVTRDVVNLEVGDEIYAFERYTPSSREPPENTWFRGYASPSIRPVQFLFFLLAMSSTQNAASLLPGLSQIQTQRPAHPQRLKRLSKYLSAFSPRPTSSSAKN